MKVFIFVCQTCNTHSFRIFV